MIEAAVQVVKGGCHGAALCFVITTVAGWLPPTAAAFSIAWYAFCFWRALRKPH